MLTHSRCPLILCKTHRFYLLLQYENDCCFSSVNPLHNRIAFVTFFKYKVVYCNCDSPNHSNFWKYFYDNFHSLGLKRLISTYLDNTQSFKTEYDGESMIKTPLIGNGDFSSDECVEILKECDVAVTNPPFSLWRQFIHLLILYYIIRSS